MGFGSSTFGSVCTVLCGSNRYCCVCCHLVSITPVPVQTGSKYSSAKPVVAVYTLPRLRSRFSFSFSLFSCTRQCQQSSLLYVVDTLALPTVFFVHSEADLQWLELALLICPESKTACSKVDIKNPAPTDQETCHLLLRYPCSRHYVTSSSSAPMLFRTTWRTDCVRQSLTTTWDDQTPITMTLREFAHQYSMPQKRGAEATHRSRHIVVFSRSYVSPDPAGDRYEQSLDIIDRNLAGRVHYLRASYIAAT